MCTQLKYFAETLSGIKVGGEKFGVFEEFVCGENETAVKRLVRLDIFFHVIVEQGVYSGTDGFLQRKIDEDTFSMAIRELNNRKDVILLELMPYLS